MPFTSERHVKWCSVEIGMTAERVGESFMGSPPLSLLSSWSAVVGFSVLAQHDLAEREVRGERDCRVEERVSLPEGATGLPAAIRKAYLLMRARYIQIFITFYGFSLCADSDRMTDCIILKKPSNHMLTSSICSSKKHLHPLNICRNMMIHRHIT